MRDTYGMARHGPAVGWHDPGRSPDMLWWRAGVTNDAATGLIILDLSAVTRRRRPSKWEGRTLARDAA